MRLLHADETVSRKDLMWKFFVAETVACIPSRCGGNFLTGTAFPLVPPEFKRWS